MISISRTVRQPYRYFSAKTQGASHIVKGNPCEDYVLASASGNCIVAIACDGHGGADYVRSRIGSEYAARAARELIFDFVDRIDENKLETEKSRNEVFRQLESSIIAKWDEMISQHLNENPFSAEELASISEKAKRRYAEGSFRPAYGTTIVATALTQNYWFALQLGDGNCVILDGDGIFSQPIPEDERCMFNETTSMCDNNAISEFRYYFSKDFPKALFVASDGVANCFPGDDNAMYGFYKLIYESFTNGNQSFAEAEKELREYIPTLSYKGSRDDISIAGIVGDAISVGIQPQQYMWRPKNAEVALQWCISRLRRHC